MRAVIDRLSFSATSLLGICFALTLSGCNQTSGYLNNQAGKNLYEDGNYTAARRSFEQAMMDNPQSADYAFNVGAAMRKQGDVLGAERMFRHALTLDPGHHPASHGMASILRAQGRNAESLEVISAWNQTQPYSAESYVELAWLQQEDGDLAGAEQSLRQALRIKPNHPTALAHMGHIYQRTGRSREAAGLYRRSLAMNPYQPQVQSNLGQMAQPLGASPALQMTTIMPQVDPTLSPYPAPYATYRPTGPVPAYASQPMMPAPTGITPMPSGTMQGPVQLGAPIPLSNADPAHAPTVGALPSIAAF